MIFLHLFLIRIFILRCAAVLCVLVAVLAGSAFVEGKHPDLIHFVAEGLPCAVCISACWTISQWRREGGHTAFSAGGASPLQPVGSLAFFSSVILAMVSLMDGPPEGTLEVAPGVITIKSAQGSTMITWANDVATWQHPGGKLIQTRQLQAPSAHARNSALGGWIHLTPCMPLCIILWLLGFKRRALGLSATLSLAGIAFLGGEILRGTLVSIML